MLLPVHVFGILAIARAKFLPTDGKPERRNSRLRILKDKLSHSTRASSEASSAVPVRDVRLPANVEMLAPGR